MPKYESSPKVKKKSRNKARPLKLLNVNCQSLQSKTGAWRHLLNKHEPDVVVATETWLKPDIFDAELDTEDYVIYRRDRTHTIGGGVLIAVHKTINSTEIKLNNHQAELLWVKLILTGQQNIIVGACYRPHSNDKTTLPALKQNLDNILENQHRNVIIAGDFNYPGWDWKNQEIKPSCQNVQLHEDFKSFLNDNGLVQEVMDPTRENNTLDLIATNFHERINKTEVLAGISDHNCVLTEISARVTRRREAPHKIWLYKRADWESFGKYVQKKLATLNTDSSIEDTWNTIKTCIDEGANQFIPSKMSKRKKSLPYISADLDKKMTLRDRLETKSKKKGGLKVEQRYKQLKRECQRQLRREHYRYVENLLTDDENPGCVGKKFWSYLKHKRADSCGIGTLREGDRLITDSTEKAEVLNRQFNSVFTPPTIDATQSQPISDMPDFTISTEGVHRQLRSLNPYKATGPDDISPRVLKELADVLSHPLTQLFQKSLDTSTVPDDWKKARVTPLYKKGDKYMPSNYRPISLTCVTCKILEHIVTSQLTRHLETKGKLNKRQHGFRKLRSCESQLTELTCDISKKLDEGKEIDAIFLDFSKAFDKVDHSKLISKLKSIGVSNQVSNWVQNLLADRSQVVVVDGYASSPCPVTSGVPQGSVIGPILFLVYINDLPDTVASKTRLFADDTVIYNTSENHQSLQKDLDALQAWEKEWKMEFNPLKCEHIKFSRKRSKGLDNTYILHNIAVPKTDSVKYLGVKLESGLKWNDNTTYITNKASSRLGYVRRVIPPTLPLLRAKAYSSLVRPILEYSSSVWDGSLTKTQQTKIEAVQRRAARTVNNISRTDHTTSTTKLIEDLEWQSLKTRRENRRLGLFRAIHFGEVATDITEYINLHPHTNITRRHDQQYLIPHCNSDLHKKSFFVSTAKLWNNLSSASTLLVGPPVAG